MIFLQKDDKFYKLKDVGQSETAFSISPTDQEKMPPSSLKNIKTKRLINTIEHDMINTILQFIPLGIIIYIAWKEYILNLNKLRYDLTNYYFILNNEKYIDY